jgi:hypothetical protein
MKLGRAPLPASSQFSTGTLGSRTEFRRNVAAARFFFSRHVTPFSLLRPTGMTDRRYKEDPTGAVGIF